MVATAMTHSKYGGVSVIWTWDKNFYVVGTASSFKLRFALDDIFHPTALVVFD